MSVPYRPTTLFLDSIPLLEVNLDAWQGPGSPSIKFSRSFDVADFLPAVHELNPPTGSAGAAFSNFSANSAEPRYVVSWHCRITGRTYTGADPTIVLFLVASGTGLEVSDFSNCSHVIPIMGEPATIQYGQFASPTLHQINGRVHLNGRRHHMELQLTGTEPTEFSFGAYLRVL